MNFALPVITGIEWSTLAETPAEASLAARAASGEAASARLSIRETAPGEFRASLDGSVRPNFLRRGLGSAILAWAESRAGAFALENPGATVTLAANTKEPGEPARRLFAANGLALAVAEDEMRRPTTHAPSRPFPNGIVLRQWDEMSAPLFHHAYASAFRDRPGFPNWEESRWRNAFTASPDFRPSLSAVALDGPEPAAYAVLWAEDALGWVTQMGVRPAWRGKGLGGALLGHALNAFAAEGIATAALEVATNNPAAMALYRRMGFTVAGTYESWRKTIA